MAQEKQVKNEAVLDSNDDKEVELFNQIIRLPKEVRNRLLEAVRTYDLVMSNAEQVLPKGKC
jgi:hypothetical protein